VRNRFLFKLSLLFFVFIAGITIFGILYGINGVALFFDFYIVTLALIRKWLARFILPEAVQSGIIYLDFQVTDKIEDLRKRNKDKKK